MAPPSFYGCHRGAGPRSHSSSMTEPTPWSRTLSPRLVPRLRGSLQAGWRCPRGLAHEDTLLGPGLRVQGSRPRDPAKTGPGGEGPLCKAEAPPLFKCVVRPWAGVGNSIEIPAAHCAHAPGTCPAGGWPNCPPLGKGHLKPQIPSENLACGPWGHPLYWRPGRQQKDCLLCSPPTPIRPGSCLPTAPLPSPAQGRATLRGASHEQACERPAAAQGWRVESQVGRGGTYSALRQVVGWGHQYSGADCPTPPPPGPAPRPA